MMEIQIEKDVFISDLYCIYLRDISAVVVSDLHLGFEEEMNLRGLFLPKLQREHVEKMIDGIIETYNPEMVIINGDFKHEFSRNLPQEWDDIIHFIDRYKDNVNLYFIRGNHDNYLLTILARSNIELHEKFENERYFIYHGDKDLGLKKLTILGHEHPSISLRDEIGGVFKIHSFIYNPESRVLITPALSFFSSGSDVLTSLLNEEHFTPSLKHTESSKFRVFGLTEEFGLVDLGPLGEMKRH